MAEGPPPAPGAALAGRAALLHDVLGFVPAEVAQVLQISLRLGGEPGSEQW